MIKTRICRHLIANGVTCLLARWLPLWAATRTAKGTRVVANSPSLSEQAHAVLCLLVGASLALATPAAAEAKKDVKVVEAGTRTSRTEKRGLHGLLGDYPPFDGHSYGQGYGYDHGHGGLVIGEPHVKSVVITKEVPVGILQPYAVPIVKHVGVPVKVRHVSQRSKGG